MLYGNYCYIIIENFPEKFSPCTTKGVALLYVLQLTENRLHIPETRGRLRKIAMKRWRKLKGKMIQLVNQRSVPATFLLAKVRNNNRKI